MSEEKRMLNQIIAKASTEAYELGEQVGFEKGREVGQAEGTLYGMAMGAALERQKFSKAVSEGTKYKSPECARALRTTNWDEANKLVGNDFQDDQN